MFQKKWELLNPRIHFGKGKKFQEIWFVLISLSRLQFFDVLIRVSVRRRCLPLYESKSVWSLVCGNAMFAIVLIIQLHAVQVTCWSDWILRRIFFCGSCCQQILRLLSLRVHFPLLSIFLDFCHYDPCVVVLFFVAFHPFSFL